MERDFVLFNMLKIKLGVVCLFGNAKKLFKFVDMAEMVFHKRKKLIIGAHKVASYCQNITER